jgi:hypothetical protein
MIVICRKKCLDMTNEAGQEHAIQTFDQQLYAIAQQVKWSKPDIFNRHILRLGGFPLMVSDRCSQKSYTSV